MKISKILTLLIAALGIVTCTKNHHTDEQQAEAPVVRYEYGLPIDSFRIDTCVVKSGETLGGMLNRLGATRQQVAGITMMPRSEFDVRTILPGKTYYALFQKDTAGVEQLCYYIYKPNIRETIVLHLTDSMHVERFEKPIIRQNHSAEVVIESSLWNAMVSKNLPPELAIAMMIGWFSLPLTALIIVGLAAGGVIFNYLSERFGTVFVPWGAHMFANFAINTIGFILLVRS